jgi:hypothetical protein
MEIHNLEHALESRETLTKWLWRIHNEVNSKLRNQNLLKEDDPPFEKVEKFYKNILKNGCSKTEFPGWDFLFSIADLHPMSKIAKGSLPMPGAPPCDTIATLKEKNKWNCLKPEERLPLYKAFWMSIGAVLPFKEWRESWLHHSRINQSDLHSRSAIMKWLWQIRCSMENDLELLNKCEYSSLCKTLQVHRSNCSKSRRARTCRKRNKNTV